MKSLLALAALVAAPLLAPAPQAPDELPRAWRERTDPELRAQLDRLEGKPAPSLAKLEHWSNTEARGWRDLRGKVVLIDVWATWCKPCLETLPELKRLHGRYAVDGLVVLGVHSATRYDRESMTAFARAQGLAYALAADTRRGLSGALGVRSLPSYFVVDRKGVLRVAGADRTKLADIVEHLLTEGGRALAPGKDAPWPPYVSKQLYAKQDLRGKPAPARVVDRWLTDAPETKGKVLVIDFWATWCKPCRKLSPKLNAWARKLADDVVVIGISNETESTVRAHLTQHPATYAIAIDEQERMHDAIGVQGIPHVLVVSSDGIVRWQGYPLLDEDPLTLDLLQRVVARDRAERAKRE